MPLHNTRGAASALGFGFSASAAVSPPPIFIQMMTDGSPSGTQVYQNNARNVSEAPDGSLYVGWNPNGGVTNVAPGSAQSAKLNSSGVLQWFTRYAPTSNYITTCFSAYDSVNARVVVTGNSFTGAADNSAIFTLN